MNIINELKKSWFYFFKSDFVDFIYKIISVYFKSFNISVCMCVRVSERVIN